MNLVVRSNGGLYQEGLLAMFLRPDLLPRVEYVKAKTTLLTRHKFCENSALIKSLCSIVTFCLAHVMP